MQIPDVPPQLLAALVEAAAGQRLALVGGVVRDLLLHRHHQDPWRGLPDLDLVVEGRAAELVARLPAALANQIGRPVAIREQHHGRYGTAELELALPPECGGTWLLDVASARRELYPQPAANPEVTPGTLEQDLARRDLTVNAMALELNAAGAGVCDAIRLLDPFCGRGDLAQRHLRFLHPQSLRDDPTRLLRAARYAARLGFVLAPEAIDQVMTTLQAWPWAWRFGDDPREAPPALGTRLRMELELLLDREPWSLALGLLQHWGGLALVDRQLQHDLGWQPRLRWARRLQLPMPLAVVANAEDPCGLADRLQLPSRQRRWLRQMLDLEAALRQAPPIRSPSGWAALCEAPGQSPQATALALLRGVEPRQPLLRWWLRWRHVGSPLTPQQVMEAEGLHSGPALGQRLRVLRAHRLDQLS